MSNKYILHPDGSIKKIEDGQVQADKADIGDVVAEINKERFANTEPYSYTIKNKDDLEGINEGLGYNYSISDNYTGPIKETSQNNSFGFTDNNENPKEYISFNTFLDKDDNNTIPYASEFEIITGIRPGLEYTRGDGYSELEEFTFVFEYLATVITKIAAVEAIIMAVSHNSYFRDGFGVEQRRIYAFGEYDFTDYDVFTRYITEVLNYPKHKSNLEDRLLAYFVGLIEYLSTDNFFDFESLIQKSGIFSIDNYLTVLLEYTSKLALSSLLTEQGKKKLLFLTKKFNTQQYWIENNLYPHKKKYTSDDIINPFNYYHFKFIIERINVGLKIINRRITRKTDLSNRRYSDNRVSGYRTSSKSTHKITTNDKAAETKADTDRLKTQGLKFAESNIVDISKFDYTASIHVIDAILTGRYGDEKVDYTWDNSSVRESTGLNLSKIPQAFLYNKNLENILTPCAANVNILEYSSGIGKNFAKTKNRRLPIGLINKIEESLELEYVPFYFHDIRTNELVSLHAFVESVSDSYSPEYSSSGGFGRIDDVKTYVKTTRNISLSFFIAALSPEDHDLMWYQINKLVSMVYPQWSKGFEISKSDNVKFTYPFSQVITSSPLIRIRLGDVITSNYSKTNLTRIFGVNENNKTHDSVYNYSGEQEYVTPGKYEVFKVSPVFSGSIGLISTGRIFSLDKEAKIIVEGIEIKQNENGNEVFVQIEEGSDFRIKVPRDFIVKKNTYWFDHNKKTYVLDDSDEVITINHEFRNKERKAFKSKMMDAVSFGAVNNPFTASYESGMSKGLAGHITNLDLNYQDMTWETSRIGSKAPMLAKINITFAPIHDIPPGLDHMGMMRAPHYNVGTLNNSMFGDPLDKESTNDFRDKVMEKYTKSIKLG